MSSVVEIVPYVPMPKATATHDRAPLATVGGKYAPAPLITESSDGEVVFADAAWRASERSREQARLFYAQGIRETKLVKAGWWREVQAQHTTEEISRVEEILGGFDLIRRQDSLVKALQREERTADLNPLVLDSLEQRIHAFRPNVEAVRALIAAASERELALVKLVQRFKRLDRKARGWKLKAQRQIACGMFGMQYDAEKCGRAYYRPFHCRNRYCPNCGPHVHQKLVAKYLGLEKPVAEFLSGHPSYRPRILDITAIKRGDRMPSPEDVHEFKTDVKKLIAALNRKVAEKHGLPHSKQVTGYLYCLEFGFENNNLHCHGLLLSPFIEQDWLSERWREIRNDGSFRVFIAEAYSFDAAIRHALEYTGKYAAPSAERAFELELAFSGCRRVDGLGWFFNRLPKEDVQADLRCPCGDTECFLKPNQELGWQPLSYFEKRGIPNLYEVRQRGSPSTQGRNGTSWIN